MHLTNRKRAAIRNCFDQHAVRYTRNPITRWVGQSELAALRQLIPLAPQPGETPVLDFGCGTGRLTNLLLEQGYCVTGYDLSAGMLAQARLMVGPSSQITFTTDSQAIQTLWSLIVSLGILDYYPDTSPLWQEWSGLLAPNGQLIVTAPNAASPLARLYTLVSRFTCPAYAASAPQLAKAAGQAGLTVTFIIFL
jgi:2-polyprenyl-3-methyl-5-hydroxy-6-metoxy-1,4-benzoquinol methylase